MFQEKTKTLRGRRDTQDQQGHSPTSTGLPEEPGTHQRPDMDRSCHQRQLDIPEQHRHLEADVMAACLIDATCVPGGLI